MNNIYIDMDGVVADFDAAARDALEARKDAVIDGRWIESEWARIREIPHFYRHLPKTAIADSIMALARQFRDQCGYNLYMLTAIPRKNDMPDCFHDKILWMRDYYPEIEVRFGPYSHDKCNHCRPGDILVDDRTSNCFEWREQGGVAVQVLGSRPHEAVLELQALLDQHISGS